VTSFQSTSGARPGTRYFAGDRECRHVYEAVQRGELLCVAVFKEVPGDPVLGGRFRYEDGGWVHVGPCPSRPRPADPTNVEGTPECRRGCTYHQTFRDFALQRNALRMEIAHMVNPHRCGWNLLPGRLGGHPLDYSACTFREVVL
jgi:ribosomal protein S14